MFQSNLLTPGYPQYSIKSGHFVCHYRKLMAHILQQIRPNDMLRLDI